MKSDENIRSYEYKQNYFTSAYGLANSILLDDHRSYIVIFAGNNKSNMMLDNAHTEECKSISWTWVPSLSSAEAVSEFLLTYICRA